MRVRCPKCQGLSEYSEGACCPTCAVLLKAPSTRRAVAKAPPASRKLLWIGLGAGCGLSALVVVLVLLLRGGPGRPPLPAAATPAKEGGRVSGAEAPQKPAPRADPAPALPGTAPRKVAAFQRRSFIDPERTPPVGMTFDGCTPRVWLADRSSILYDLDGTPLDRSPVPPVLVCRFRIDGTSYVVRPAFHQGPPPSLLSPAWSARNEERVRWIESLQRSGTFATPAVVYLVEADRTGVELQSTPPLGHATFVDVAGQAVVLTEMLTWGRIGVGSSRKSAAETRSYYSIIDDGRLVETGEGRAIPFETGGFTFYARFRPGARGCEVSRGPAAPVAWKDPEVLALYPIPGRGQLAVRTAKGLRILAGADGRTVKEIPARLDGEWRVTASPDGSSFAVHHDRGFRIYDAGRLDAVASYDADLPLEANGAFCPKGDHFAVATPRALISWSRETGSVRASWSGNFWVRSAGPSPAARAPIPVSRPDRFFLLAPGVVVAEGQKVVDAAAARPVLQEWRLDVEGKRLILEGERRGNFLGGSAGGVVERLSRGTGNSGDEMALYSLPGFALTAKFRVERDARLLVPRCGRSASVIFEKYASGKRTWYIYGPDGSGPRQLGLPGVGDSTSASQVLSVGGDRALLFAPVSVPAEVQGRPVRRTKLTGFLVDTGGVQGRIVREIQNGQAMSPDGKVLLVTDPALGQVRLHRADDGQELNGGSFIPGRPLEGAPMDHSPDGRHLAIATTNQLVVIDVLKSRVFPGAPTMDATAVCFLDDRRILVMADQEAELFEIGPSK